MTRAWDARKRRVSYSPPEAVAKSVRLEEIMKKIASVIAAVAILGGSAGLWAQSSHVIVTPQEAKWGPAPPLLPEGAQIAVVAGDPMKAAPYTVRLKFPANYAIPAHSHPTDENVAVVSGAVTFGMGDKLVKSGANKTLGPGGYALMPAGMNHFAYTSEETTILLYGMGPVDFKYVNPSDDPRNHKSSTR
jgi:quercetin dioxygenase-like cupin family protein